MSTFDLTPLWRSTVGFDRLFNLLDEANRRNTEENNYPPTTSNALARTSTAYRSRLLASRPTR